MKDRVEKEIVIDAGDNEDDHTISDSDELHSPPSSTRFLSFSTELSPTDLKEVYIRQAYNDIYDKHVKDTKKDHPDASIFYEEG